MKKGEKSDKNKDRKNKTSNVQRKTKNDKKILENPPTKKKENTIKKPTRKQWQKGKTLGTENKIKERQETKRKETGKKCKRE